MGSAAVNLGRGPRPSAGLRRGRCLGGVCAQVLLQPGRVPYTGPCSGLTEAFTESVTLEEISAIIPSPTCDPTLPWAPSAMPSLSLNSCRDSNSITSLGSPFQCLIILSMEKFILMSDLNLPWCTLTLGGCLPSLHLAGIWCLNPLARGDAQGTRHFYWQKKKFGLEKPSWFLQLCPG